MQLTYNYNIIDKKKSAEFFHLSVSIRENTAPNQLIIDICAQLVRNDSENHSDMFVIEAELPTGYTTGSEKLKEIRDFTTILFTETKKSDTVAIIYLHGLQADHEMCFSFEATKIYEIAERKPVPVVIYDYYNKARETVEYYQIKTSLCDICEDDDCTMDCKQNEEGFGIDSSSNIFDLLSENL